MIPKCCGVTDIAHRTSHSVLIIGENSSMHLPIHPTLDCTFWESSNVVQTQPLIFQARCDFYVADFLPVPAVFEQLKFHESTLSWKQQLSITFFFAMR
jgi:hypothetical protein